MRDKCGFTLIELMIVIAILALLAAIAVPSLLNSLRAANERNASSSLKTIATAQADFRSNDRDNNGVCDYWTADVAGLFCIDNTSTGAPTPASIRLIEVSLALADGNPAAGALSNGNYGTAVGAYGTQGPKAGYRYLALIDDHQVMLNGGIGTYATDTDGTGDLAHNASIFGFGCGPSGYGSGGTHGFIINQANTIYRRDFGGDLYAGGVPTGLYDFRWPLDSELAQSWGKLD